MSSELDGRIALITGGGRGLGEIMAHGLAKAGAAVALVSRSMNQLEKVAKAISNDGGKAFSVAADVTNRKQVSIAVKAAQQALGPVDILVNNAGVDEPFGPVGIIDPDDWWRAQAVHVLGPMYFMSAIVPGMAERKRGCIINICSIAGLEPVANMSAYAVGKSTEIRVTEHVAAERKGDGIAAFAIEPGTIFTGMAENTLNSPDAQQWIPEGLAYLKSITEEQSEASKVRLVEMVTSLASGKYDALSGRFLMPTDDFDTLLADA